jgi:hypothetical protein
MYEESCRRLQLANVAIAQPQLFQLRRVEPGVAARPATAAPGRSAPQPWHGWTQTWAKLLKDSTSGEGNSRAPERCSTSLRGSGFPGQVEFGWPMSAMAAPPTCPRPLRALCSRLRARLVAETRRASKRHLGVLGERSLNQGNRYEDWLCLPISPATGTMVALRQCDCRGILT